MGNLERRPQQNNANRQREKRLAAERAARNRTMTRRAFIAGGASIAALTGIGLYKLSAESKQVEDGNVQAPQRDYSEFFPLKEVTADEVLSVAGETIDLYQDLFQIDLDKDQILGSISLVPNVSKMSKAEYDEICKPSIPCNEAAGFSYENGILVFKDAFDQYLSGANNSKISRELKEQTLRGVISHEITHFSAANYLPSDQLYESITRLAKNDNPDFDTSKYTKMITRGANIKGKKIEGEGGFLIFRSVEEGEAIAVANFVTANSGKKVIGKPELNDYYFDQGYMVKELVTKMRGNLKDGLKMLIGYRMQEFGREAYCVEIGKIFNADQGSEMEYGCKVLNAINWKNYASFRELTKA